MDIFTMSFIDIPKRTLHFKNERWSVGITLWKSQAVLVAKTFKTIVHLLRCIARVRIRASTACPILPEKTWWAIYTVPQQDHEFNKVFATQTWCNIILRICHQSALFWHAPIMICRRPVDAGRAAEKALSTLSKLPEFTHASSRKSARSYLKLGKIGAKKTCKSNCI